MAILRTFQITVWRPFGSPKKERRPVAAWWHCCCCLDWLQGRQMHFGHARSEHLNFPTFIFWHPITQIIGHMLILVKAYQVIQLRPFKASAFAVKLLWLLLSNEVHTLYSHLCNFWPSHGFILKMRLVKQPEVSRGLRGHTWTWSLEVPR